MSICPKNKSSKARRDKRRANWKMSAPNLVKCSKCELKAWCRGCPAVANGTSGNFYGADPQCWKTRNEITGERLEEQ